MTGSFENSAIEYGRFIGTHPKTMALFIVFLTLLGWFGNSLLTMSVESNEDMLPENYPQIEAMKKISYEFGGDKTGNIVVEISPSISSSSEIRDLRDPRALEYMDVLAQKALALETVSDATTLADIAGDSGRIPESLNLARAKIEASPLSDSYISRDYSMALVRLGFTSSIDDSRVYADIQSIIESSKAPPGVTANPSGEFAISKAIFEKLRADMSSTSRASMIGILFVIVMLFRSVRYGLTSLLAIVFGIIWSFGLMGLWGMSISNTTSGASSMIMGIGIDFGIQVTSRFRIELKRKDIANAMAQTIRAVSMPMGTTTLAALIGFQAMSLGELKVLADIGSMMSFGTLACMMAALTVVPVALVWGEILFSKEGE